MDLQHLLEIDRSLLFFFNGAHNVIFDPIVPFLTKPQTWLVFYCALLFLLLSHKPTDGHLLLVVCSVLFIVLVSSSIDGWLVKPLVGRIRPSLDPTIRSRLILLDGYTADGYSFYSSHASNAFALAAFFSLLFRRFPITLTMFAWATFYAWTRLYLGVHYPSDSLAGAVAGILIGLLTYCLYRRALPAGVVPLPPGSDFCDKCVLPYFFLLDICIASYVTFS